MDEGWSHEQELRGVSGSVIYVGENLDGVVRLIDADDYSIIVDQRDAIVLRNWLNRFIERRNRSTEQ